MLKDNLKNVEECVQAACDRAGRKREEVTLIAVSKTKPVEMLQEIYDENIRDFGENKVQELCDKIEKMPKDIKWHMIGHLQRNKVKYIVGQVALIHSVDSYRVFNSFWLGPVTTQVHYLKPILFEEYGSLKTQEIAALVRDRINEKINDVLKITEKQEK
jgi:hypothetical protein